MKEQAGTYTRSFLDSNKLFTVDVAKEILMELQQKLLSEGYTMYMDSWNNSLYNGSYYKAVQKMDKSGDLNLIAGLAYEIESWMDVDKNLDKVLKVQKYASEHVKTNWVKIFTDSTVETGTGFIEPLYTDGHQGIVNWPEAEVTEIMRKSNANGGKDELRNTLVHVHFVNDSDYKRMTDHNIYITERMKSFFDNDVNITSLSDFPAVYHTFGIIEVAVTGLYHEENTKVWWPEELITREQAITALTINIAKQLFLGK